MSSSNDNGFLLLEALIAMLILSVTFVAVAGAVLQALRVSERAEETTGAVLKADNALFELESGLRADLVKYGGRENLGGDYQLETIPRDGRNLFHEHRIRVLKRGNPVLEQDVFLRETFLQ